MTLGSGALWVAVVSGLVLVAAGVLDARRLARRASLLATLGATASTSALALAFAREDWRYEYVADHTRSQIALLPRMAGLWAGPEGSLLLWGTLCAWAVATALHLARGRPEWRGVATFGGVLVAGYLAVVAVVASPFRMLDIPPVDGLGLQPILEHPAMVWHPPLLYAGVIGLLVPSMLVAGAAWHGDPMRIRPMWWRIPLGVLALGLLSGARWAHAELGWGGYWAWDPIESAGLAAWLAGGAALHMQHRSPLLPERMSVLIGILPGLGAIWATTLTRIGVVSSVHAFADRPALRLALLGIAGVTSAMLLTCVVVARPNALRTNRPGSPARIGGWILLVAALYVAAGTYEPLLEAATSGDRVAIAGTYFARILWPVAILGGAAALNADRRWWPGLAGAMIGGLVTPFAAGPFALALGGIGGAVAASALSLVRSRRPGATAHLGSGLLLIGVAGTMATSVTAVQLRNDEPHDVDGVTLIHRSVTLDDGAVTSVATATVEVDGAAMTPSLVSYHLRGVTTAEVAHRSSGLDEVQIVLLDADADSARYRINRFPRIHLIWIGGVIMAVSLIATRSRRHRESSQSRRRLRASNWSSVEPSSSTTGGAVG